MNAVLTCPDADTLRQHLHGTLPTARSLQIERHVAECLTCTRRMEGLQQHDPLLSGEHQSGSIRKLDQTPIKGTPLVSPSAPTVSLATAPAQTVVQDGVVIPDTGETGLSPPQGPGEIGRLGKYRILKIQGAGGMGTVYLAEDTELGRQVAVKTMRPSIARYEEARQRFLREARATAAFQHDHIVPIHQVGEENGIPFLAMPFLQGESLDTFLQRGGTLPPAEVARVGEEIAAGLAAAHAEGLVHRDIKPANIWLESTLNGDPNGVANPFRVKILDFGLARSVHEQSSLTRSGIIVGTPSYMSPEQARGVRIDPRSDLFSLGVVLYRLCTGRLPFEGDSVTDVLSALAMTEPPSLTRLNPDVPVDLAGLIVRMLRKKPSDRPASAKIVSDRLGQIRRRLALQESVPEAGTPLRRPDDSVGPLPKSWRPLLLMVACGVIGGLMLAMAAARNAALAGRDDQRPAAVGVERPRAAEP